MYRPLRRRSGRNSSSVSSPARTPRLVAELCDPLVDQRLVDRRNGTFSPDYRSACSEELNTVWLGAPLSGVMSVCNTSCARQTRRGDVAGLYFEQFEGRSAFRPPRAANGDRDRQSSLQRAHHEPGGHPPGRRVLPSGTAFGQRIVNSVFTLGLMVGLSVYDTTYGTTIGNLGWEEVRFPAPRADRRHVARGDRRSCPNARASRAPTAASWFSSIAPGTSVTRKSAPASARR